MGIGFAAAFTGPQERCGTTNVQSQRPNYSRTAACRLASSESGSVGDDDYWDDLAKEIYGDMPGSQKKKKRAPEFVYPENVDPKSFFQNSEQKASAWSQWNTAIEKEAATNLEELRDTKLKQEADLWTDAAKNIASGKSVELNPIVQVEEPDDSEAAEEAPVSNPEKEQKKGFSIFNVAKKIFSAAQSSVKRENDQMPEIYYKASDDNPWIRMREKRSQNTGDED